MANVPAIGPPTTGSKNDAVDVRLTLETLLV